MNYTIFAGSLIGGYASGATQNKYENLFSWTKVSAGDFGATTGVPTGSADGTVTNVISTGLTATAPSTTYLSGTVDIAAGGSTYTIPSAFSINNNLVNARTNGNKWLHPSNPDDFLILTTLQD